MKIMLISPQYNIPRYAEMYPSGALLVLGTILYNNGYDVKCIHMVAYKKNLADIEKEVKYFKPHIVGISFMTFQTKYTKLISKIIKEVDKNILLVCGGPHVSVLKENYFKENPYVDVLVYGEGEETILEIVKGYDFSKIKGICYDHKVNPPRERFDINKLPLPKLEIIGGIKKFSGAPPIFAKPSMYVMGSRGCPFKCTFCCRAVYGNRVLFRSPEAVFNEIVYLYEKYGIKEILFQDDNFNLNHNWAKKIFELIVNNKLNKRLVFKIGCRCNRNLINKEFFELAKEANVKIVFFGVESGDQNVLIKMKKEINLNEIIRAFDTVHSCNIRTEASFMVGNIGETKESVEKSLKLAKRIKPYHYGFSIAIPFPGTELREELKNKNHLLIEDWDKYDYNVCVIRTDELTKEEIEKLHRKASRSAKIRMLMNLNLDRVLEFIRYFFVRDIKHLIYFLKLIYNAFK